MHPQVITELKTAQTIDLTQLPSRHEPQRVLMCPPDYFDIVDVKNAFMEGNIGSTNHGKAVQQWQALRTAYQQIGKEVVTIEAVPGCEDMVFTANQVLPGIDDLQRPYVLLSHMRHASRRNEVPHFARWFAQQGYQIIEMDFVGSNSLLFEGQGDAIWHPGRKLIWGGYGHRTSLAAYQEVAARLNTSVIALELPTTDFYHLDTCFSILDEQTVLIYPQAFAASGLEIIYQLFPRVIEANSHDAHQAFACNAHALDSKYVVIERQALATIDQLKRSGYQVIEVDTSEFIKSGGSVFCMKMMIY